MASQRTTTNETIQLGPFTLPRIWNGLWQLSSNAWGSAPSTKIRTQMLEYARQGYIAFGSSDFCHLFNLRKKANNKLRESYIDMVRLLFFVYE